MKTPLIREIAAFFHLTDCKKSGSEILCSAASIRFAFDNNREQLIWLGEILAMK